MGVKIKTTLSDAKIFFCTGCKNTHSMRVQINPQTPHPCWSFNGNHEQPTFKPSILVTCDFPVEYGGRQICHSFVTDGKIEFLGDCTHALKGKTVEIPDWPYAIGEYGGIKE